MFALFGLHKKAMSVHLMQTAGFYFILHLIINDYKYFRKG